MASAAASRSIKHRIELFFNDTNDLKERVRFLHSHGFSAFNLVNKSQKDTVEEWVKCIHQEVATAHVCAHYSLKYNKVARQGVDAHMARLQGFCTCTHAQEVLILSGSGGKNLTWNTVNALEAVPGSDARTTTVSVAYNPYFPDPNDQQLENQRLEQKLKSGRVSKVYLQFGTNLDRLKNALEKLQDWPAVAVAGSLFLPTSKLIAQQKFRPWNGVFLSPEFLSGPQNARSIIIQMMELYQKYNVEMLWEAPGIRTDKDLQVVFDLAGELLADPSSVGKRPYDQKEANSNSSANDANEKTEWSSPTKRPKKRTVVS
jgi:5,10-methylenetetrahydrofolate reductase